MFTIVQRYLLERTGVKLLLLAGACCTITCGTNTIFAEDNVPYAATDRYDVRDVRGWQVLVYRPFAEQEPQLAADTLALLDAQLYQITRVVQPEPLAKLRQIRIWVEEDEPHHPCMAYHPDAGWLRDHGMNPDKQRCVEIANARNFLSWTRQQPWMVLHELAHGYHHQFLEHGFENEMVARVFQRASEQAELYSSVLHINGSAQKHYALTNPMEYFAEATEAYFGTNDFYPFVSSELERHDPDGFRVIEAIWGGKQQ